MAYACQFSLLLSSHTTSMNSILLNNDLSRLSINTSLTLSFNESFLIKFILISYYSWSISLLIKFLTLLKCFYVTVFAQESTQPMIFLRMPVKLAQYQTTVGVFHN